MAQQGPRGLVVVELVRLAVVLLLTAVGFTLGPDFAAFFEGSDPVFVRFVTSMLGALVGYVIGGIGGRSFLAGVDLAEERLRRVEAAVLVASGVGATLGGLVSLVIAWPILLLPAKVIAVPTAMVVVVLLTYFGGRLGAARGGDLLRFLGARGRLEVSAPTRGSRAKLVDTSALIDGRIVDVARTGFLDGTLVVPRFVLDELQGLADLVDPRKRNAGRRGLDTLRTMQEEAIVGFEVTEEDVPRLIDVDAKLVELARTRGASLVTVDSNLARVAEISGVRVLNLHALATSLRPPVLPGERLELSITKEGREVGQGVGYLPDGTMVVVEKAADQVGRPVLVEVTSLLQTRSGRMVFANLAEESG